MRGYIGLGSNLGDRSAHLAAALTALRAADVQIEALSSVWETEPVDATGPLFLNMVAAVACDLEPREFLDLLLAIERAQGRERRGRHAPRTLDLDLLTWGDLEIEERGLQLPHPRMWERRFVIEPLAELAPDLLHRHTGRMVAEQRRLLEHRGGVRRVGDLQLARAEAP